MKTCPQCGTRYSDDSLAYCLQDGTPLVGPVTNDVPTVVLDETSTAEALRGERVQVPINATVGRPGETSGYNQPQPAAGRSNTALAVLATAVGMLVLFAVVGLAALYFWSSRHEVVENKPVSNNTTAKNDPQKVPSPAANPSRTVAPSTPASTPSPETPTGPKLSSYPETTRLKFARGAYSTRFAGDVNPGDNRSLVLACLSGQSLSAEISSPKGCVTFRGGGSSMSTTTTGGDNFLSVTNHCSSVAHFSISISVI